MTKRPPALWQALLPVLLLVVLILFNVLFLGGDTLSGANQTALFIASAAAAALALSNGVGWEEIMRSVIRTLSSAIPAILILLVIGMLSAAWMLGGVVPSMIYYGLNLLRPDYFLPAALLLAAVVSVAVGSSWSTIATIGVALLGIGRTLGFSDAAVAGAIISGAYFGDKISPLSDTTNLASAVAGTPLFTHIRYMMQTTVPSFLLTLGLFVLLTFAGHRGETGATPADIQSHIAAAYHIHPLLFAVPVLTIWMIVRKMPAIPVLFIGTLSGLACALIFQTDVVAGLTEEGRMTFTGVYRVLLSCLYGSTGVSTGSAEIDSLLATGGMAGMLNTVWLIIMAMVFGGTLEAGRFLEKIMSALTRRVRSTGGLVTATASSSILFNLTAGDQYMAIVIPGKMFSGPFRKQRLRPELLSRTLEDAGTVTSVLIPWNTCGATQASILGVSTALYAPYAFFCYISPLMTLLFAWLNIRIRHADPEEEPDGSSEADANDA